MKRTFSFDRLRSAGLIASSTGLIAATYGLVRLAYGLFLPDVRAELGLEATQAGLISSAASAIYCLAAMVAFFVAGRRPRTLVVAAALSASAGAAGMAASHGTGAFALFAIIGSAGGGLVSPGLVEIVRRNVAADANDRSQARVNAGTGPGLVAAGILAVVLLPNWRLAWFCVAAFTVVVSAAVLLLDRDSRRPADDGTAGGRVAPPGAWFSAHRHIIMAVLLMGAGSAAMWNDGRTTLIDSGATDGESVIAWIALGLGGTAVIAAAPLMNARHPRTAWTTTTLTIAVASAALGLAPQSTAVTIVACAAFGWGYIAGTSALIGWTTDIDATRAPAGTSLLFIALVLGQAVGAAATGALITIFGSATAFLTAGTVCLAAAALPQLARAGFLWRGEAGARNQLQS